MPNFASVLSFSFLPSMLVSAGGPFGLAQTPPMGWRSWNAFHVGVSQTSMEGIMDAVASRNRTVNGVPTSLLDVGYTDVGLDDAWQACGQGSASSFHDANGRPIVNTTSFPDMRGMVAHAHGLGLTAGWYLNNCRCRETGITDEDLIEKIYHGNVQALVNYGYDSLKLDGCSQFRNQSHWAALMNATGRPVVVENCAEPQDPQWPVDPEETCPYNFFRTSLDIASNWKSVMFNLHSTRPFQGITPLSRPGCWAYPDMLEVGNLGSLAANRAHFGAWCITSSPLVLGFDLRDNDKMNSVWDIITNPEAIAVNQNWAGHPGRLVASWPPPVAGDSVYAVPCDELDETQEGWEYIEDHLAISRHGFCLDEHLRLFACNQSATQNFTQLADGSLMSAQGTCVDIAMTRGYGPNVRLARCNGQTNQVFHVEAGHFISVRDKLPGGLCLAARAARPPAIGTLQVWAKPQPSHSMAVLVLSNGELNGTFYVNFTEVGLHSQDHEVAVRDIWALRDVGTFVNGFTVDLDELGEKDSRFFFLSPGGFAAI